MTFFVSLLLGYLIGALPTANTIAGLAGIDLRADGSRNAGANNARRLGGFRLAVPVLIVEAAKGSSAVLLGGALGDEWGMVAGGIGAILGNVFNIWYQFSGGKGLAISLGVLAVAWPFVLVPVLIAIGAVALLTKSSGIAALVALISLVLLSLVWISRNWPTPWGLTVTSHQVVLALAIAGILTPKHLRDALGHSFRPG